MPEQSNSPPRARCCVCRADVAVRADGTLREHPDHRNELYNQVYGGLCGPIAVGTCPASRLRVEASG